MRLLHTEILADAWGVLKRVTFEHLRRDGRRETLIRQVYDHGDAATVLPYDPATGHVLLASQFRLPAYLNGHPDPVIEACAGRLDGDDAATCARKEALEELGYRLGELEQVFDAFVSPGADTERVTGFLAPYGAADRAHEGGGLAHEGEDIAVLELPFEEAFAGIQTGRIADAKTIMLLMALKLKGVMPASTPPA
ncbi:MAG: NUDIX domain-containing protein [Caulobacteraceae bacterium]|nr:NUDIX domain-containing protein [Caulobacteraceae bacterium]